MKRLLSKTAVKVTAFLLCLILAVTAVCSVILAVVMFSYTENSSGREPDALRAVENPLMSDMIYDGVWDCAVFFHDLLTTELNMEPESAAPVEIADTSETADTSAADATASEDSDSSGEDTGGDTDSVFTSDYGMYYTYSHSTNPEDFTAENSNFYAQLIDRNGLVIASTDSGVTDFSSYVPVSYMDWNDWYDDNIADRYTQGKSFTASAFADTYRNTILYQFPGSDDNPKYRILLCVNTQFTADDGLRTADRVWNTVYGFRDLYVPLAAVSCILFVILFCLLMAASGRRPDKDDTAVALRKIDRIPFDLLTVIWLILVIIPFASGMQIGNVTVFTGFFWRHLTLFVTLFCGAVAAVTALILSWAMTIATRAKTHTLLRNNVICMAARALGRSIKKGVNSVKSLWLCVIFLAVWAFVNFMIEVLCWDVGLRLFLLFLVNGASVVGILWLLSQMRRLEQGVKNMSEGDFETKIDTHGMIGPFRHHAECLNSIGDGMNRAVEERMKSERMKTELITNVSHDIKTPLTSIVNYVDLLKKEDLHNSAADGYVEVLDRQASRLRKLIEDLIEASKASTGNIKVTKDTFNLCEIVRQISGEYAERFAVNHLQPVIDMPEEGAAIRADGRHLWRVLDNLMNNISKYAMPGSRVYLSVSSSAGRTRLTLRNISREQLNAADSSDLLERFVRGDSSRTTEGSGLGLSIAKSLTELMGGTFELAVDGDLFKVTLTFAEAEKQI